MLAEVSGKMLKHLHLSTYDQSVELIVKKYYTALCTTRMETARSAVIFYYSSVNMFKYSTYLNAYTHQ